ncbi:MAG: DUF4249 domain-containing protein [Chitinophagaceae bacterium]|jgi:hypothetical protein
MKLGHFLVLFVGMVFSACEKQVDFAPEDVTPKLVVDGEIENGRPPIISITRSLGYFSNVNPNIASSQFVRNAIVRISDGTRTHQLKEYTQQVSPTITLYYYSNDPANPTTAILGAFGKQYQLEIIIGSERYTASTTIPLLTKTLDSIWWKKAPNNPDSTKVVVMSTVTDPPGLGNYIRYFTQRNREPYFPGANSVFDDQIVDGRTYEVQIDRGVNRNVETAFEDYGFFNRGDTVTVKLCNIDKPTYDFWRTWEFSFQSIGNPFSAPTKVLGNISNNALGAFCGYAAQYKTVVIPK